MGKACLFHSTRYLLIFIGYESINNVSATPAALLPSPYLLFLVAAATLTEWPAPLPDIQSNTGH